MRLIGIDTGGTFTDFVWQDAGGRLHVHKELSTPHDPARAILNGLARLALSEAMAIVHGSTVATNALLQRRGARAALITTRGFRDVLEIGRQNRPDLYALTPRKPPPLIPRERRLEADERVSSGGEVLRPLDAGSLEPLLRALAADGVESVVICLLYSFLRPEHEQAIAGLVRRLGEETGWHPHLTLSSELLPEYREYERTATAVINAYVGPLMGRYLTELQAGVAPRRLSVMQSNGGAISAAEAGAEAARTVYSGPAGGVVGARFVADDDGGGAELITFDMGGTSTDVALVPGRLPITSQGEIAGLPLRLPSIDIHTVGAGGGSLAYVDAGGALHVGPASAGAEPGPACYQREYGRWRAAMLRHFPPGRATVTDANLVLGRLDPAHFLDGEMQLHAASARAALGDLASQLDMTIEQAAVAVVSVANAAMERAIRRISVERGHDPRHFTLVAFGGGGPLHACELAEALHIPRVLVPPAPGVLSALGMLVAAPTRHTSRTVHLSPIDKGTELAGALHDAFAPLAEQLRDAMGRDGHDPEALRFEATLAMRYRGQSHELDVAYTPGTGLAAVRRDFDAVHALRFGYNLPDAPVEIVTLRLSATAPAELTSTRRPPATTRDLGFPDRAVLGQTRLFAAGQFQATPTLDRGRLEPGHRFDGPALVFQYDTTTLVPPGWTATVGATGNLDLRKTVVTERGPAV
jgi:N-methylhydantoinase A